MTESEHEAFYRYVRDRSNYAYLKWNEAKRLSPLNFDRYAAVKAFDLKAGNIVLWNDREMTIETIDKVSTGRHPHVTVSMPSPSGTITETWTYSKDIRRLR